MNMVGRWRLPARLGRLALILCLLLKGMRIPRMARQNDNANVYEGVPTGAASDNDTSDRQKGLPSLPVLTFSFPRGRTARHVGPWLLLLALAVAAFPAATGGFKASPAAAANAGVRPAEAGNYTVIDLGAPTGIASSGSTAYAINDNNQVVGDYYGSGGSSHAFIWNPTGPSNGVMSDLGVGSGSHAYGINGRGHVVGQGTGGAYIAIPPPSTSTGLYTVTTLLAGGIAYGINNLDAVVATSRGGYAFIRIADPHDPSAVGAVAPVGSGSCGSSDGRAINGSGAIVGSICGKYAASSDGTSPMNAIIGRTSRAFALNSSGQTGGYWVPPDVSGNPEVHAILWDPSTNGPYPTYDSTFTDLGNIGGSFATILGINDDGVSVGYGTTGTDQPHAAISRVGASLSDLNDYIDPGSGYTLSHAYAINNNGVIVGDARTQDANGNATGPMHAVLLLPPGASLVPEPTATPNPNDTATATPEPGQGNKPMLTVQNSPLNLNTAFLQGVSQPQVVSATVQWNNFVPGFVDFVLDGVTHSFPITPSRSITTSVVGFPIEAGMVGVGSHVLRVVAGSGDVNPRSSNVKTFTVCGVAVPTWLSFLLNHGLLGLPRIVGKTRVWSAELNAPGWGATLFRIEKLKHVLKATSAELRVKFTLTQLFDANPNSFKVSVDVVGVFGHAKPNPSLRIGKRTFGLVPAKILGFDTEFKVGFSGSLEAQVNACSVKTLNGTVGFGGEASVTWKKPAVTLLADLATDGATAGIRTLFSYLNNNSSINDFFAQLGQVYLQVGVGASAEWAGTSYDNGKTPLFGFLYPNGEKSTIAPFVEGGFEIENFLGTDAVFKLFLKATVSGEYQNRWPVVSGLLPDKGSLVGQAGARLKFSNGVEIERSYTLNFDFPADANATTGGNLARALAQTPGQLSYVPHVGGPAFAVFRSASGGRQAFAARGAIGSRATIGPAVGTDALTSTTSGVLESNTYTYTVPSLAIDPVSGKALLLWVHDDRSKPANGSTEIYASRFDGSSFSTPISITDGTLPDDAPQVSWTRDGAAVAVWTRETQTPPITPTWDITTANGIQIATSSYSDTANGGTGAWSPASLLTTNPALHSTPQLARNNNGQVLAAWHENPSGTGGDADHPDTIATAFYDNGAWTTPMTAVTPISGMDGLGVGLGDNGSAVVAYGQPVRPITLTYQDSLAPASVVTDTNNYTMTADMSPTNEFTSTTVVTPSQLFTSAYDPTSKTWSAPRQLTDDDAGISHPQVVYNGANQPLAVYLSGGGTALYLRNLSTGDVISRTMTAEAGHISAVKAVRDAAGNVAVVLTGQQGAHTALYVARFDAAHRLWGNPMPLTSLTGDGIDAPTAGINGSGRLLAAYASTALSTQPFTTTLDSGQVVTSTFTKEGQVNLDTLSHAFTSSLTMTDTDLALSNPYPGLGETVGVSATVHNTGDLPLDGVAVNVYDGDPNNGGTLIGTAPATNTLTPGDAITLTVPYTVPASGLAHTLYAVASSSDPTAATNGGGHIARLVAFGPDLQLATQGASASGPNTTMVNTIIGNAGTTTSPTSTLTLARDGVPGSPVITATVPPIDPGQTITLTTPYPYGVLAAGAYSVTATVNTNGQDFAEADLSDNSDVAEFTVAPHLTIDQNSLVARPLADGREAVVGTVTNASSVPISATLMQLYVDTPFSDTTLVATTTVPALAPGGTAVVTTIWNNPTVGQHTLYDAVNMNADSAVTETDNSDHVASVDVDIVPVAATATPSPTGTTQPALAFGMSATSVDFGAQLPGGTSLSRPVTVTNTGSRTLTIAVVALTADKNGDSYQSFSLDGCGQQPDQLGIGTTFDLVAGQSCALAATFHPTANGPLSLTYQLSVFLGSKQDGAPQNLVLSGTGGATDVTGTATATATSSTTALPTSSGATTPGTSTPAATVTNPTVSPDTSTSTASATPTPTRTSTSTSTSTAAPSTGTNTAAPSATGSATPTPTSTSTPTPTNTSTATPTNTRTAAPSTGMGTSTAVSSATRSATPAPTSRSTATPTNISTASAMPISTTPAGAAAATTAAAPGSSLPPPTYTPRPTYTALPDGGQDTGPGAAPSPIVVVVTRVAARPTTPATGHGTTGRTGSHRKTRGKSRATHQALRALPAPTLSVRPGVVVSGSDITISESGLGRFTHADVTVALLGQTPLPPTRTQARSHVSNMSRTRPARRTSSGTPPARNKPIHRPVRRPVARTWTVLLYQTTVHRQADRLGRLRVRIRLGYAPRAATRALLVVTVQTTQARGARNVPITVILPGRI